MNEALVTRYKTVKCYGITKEEVEKKIATLVSENEPKIEIKVQENMEIDIVLSATGDSEDEAKAKIKPVYKQIKVVFGEKIFSTKQDISLEMSVVKLLEEHEISIATAESCTGGMLAARFIDVPGVSEVFREGFITYTNKAKRKTLNVSKMTLKKYGGPPTKPVGLVYIACYFAHTVKVEEHRFSGTRKEVREQSVNAALDLLRRSILNLAQK